MIFFSFHPSKVSWYQKTSCRAFCTVVVLIIWFFTKKKDNSQEFIEERAICLLLDGFISFCKPFLCQMPSFIRTLNPEKRGAYITFFKVNHKMRKNAGFFKSCLFLLPQLLPHQWNYKALGKQELVKNWRTSVWLPIQILPPQFNGLWITWL